MTDFSYTIGILFDYPNNYNSNKILRCDLTNTRYFRVCFSLFPKLFNGVDLPVDVDLDEFEENKNLVALLP